jgi:hypothetical protein
VVRPGYAILDAYGQSNQRGRRNTRRGRIF